ncbi:hypothetical protein OROMI_033956 [Orobanche minor]
MYGKETLKYADVTSKLLSEEKRLESSSNTSSEGAVLICRNEKKKNPLKTPTCWKCGKSGHIKRYCPGGADSAKGSNSANNVSVITNDEEFF